MTVVTLRKKHTSEKRLTGDWSAAKLYSRGQEKRRIMFLELMAWAIYNVETIETWRQWESFTKELVETREQVWGARPWPGATDNDAFLKHVQQIADVFANADADTGVKYERRKTNPLAEGEEEPVDDKTPDPAEL
jgi:hypothetical protein